MKTRQTFWIILLLSMEWGIPPALLAQDFKASLLRMRTLYEQRDQLHILMQIQVYEDADTTTPYYDEKADIRRSGDKYLYRFGSTDMLMNDHYLVMVDRTAREMICSPRQPTDEASVPDLFSTSLDSVLSLYKSPEYRGQSEGKDHYRILQKQGPVKEVDLWINTQTHLLHQIAYHYRNGQYVSILFNKFDINPTFRVDQFDEHSYVKNVNGHLQTAETFESYNLVETNL